VLIHFPCHAWGKNPGAITKASRVRERRSAREVRVKGPQGELTISDAAENEKSSFSVDGHTSCWVGATADTRANVGGAAAYRHGKMTGAGALLSNMMDGLHHRVIRKGRSRSSAPVGWETQGAKRKIHG